MNQKNNNVSQDIPLPFTVRYSNLLNSSEKVLYSDLLFLSQKNGYCEISNREIATLYGVTIPCVAGWISSLRTKGFIKIQIAHFNGGPVIERKIYPLSPNFENANTEEKIEILRNVNLKKGKITYSELA